MIRPIAMGDAHMECRYLSETVPVLTDLLAFEKVAEAPGEVTLKHPNTEWRLVVHEAGPDAPAKPMHNHFGVRVATNEEVDAAYEHLKASQGKYGIRQVGQPAYSHGSYSLYFLEPGTNGWEIECYATVLRKERERERLGGVRAPHWQTALSPERFPGRGYVPQGFTHGTLACGDITAAQRFYTDVLGLEVHVMNDHVVYIKHPKTKSYIVSAMREEWESFSPAFRFSIVLGSNESLWEAHRGLAQRRTELGLTELTEPRENASGLSFLIRDPDRNCWEITG